MGLFFNRESKGEKLFRKGMSYYNLYRFDEKYKGDPQCIRDAIHYFDQAIEAGESLALLELADIYGKGDGVPKDPALALDYLFKAERKGLKVQGALGKRFFYGSGTDVDYDKAFRYLSKAASSGEPFGDVYIPLAECYLRGLGCPKDPNAAKQLIEKLKGSKNYEYCKNEVEAFLMLMDRELSENAPKAHTAVQMACDKGNQVPLQASRRDYHMSRTNPAVQNTPVAAPSPVNPAKEREIRMGCQCLKYGDYFSAWHYLYPYVISTPELQSDFELAEKGLKECVYDNESSAQENLERLAQYIKLGGKQACATMSEVYLRGKGVERNLKKALQYALQAVKADEMYEGPISYPNWDSDESARFNFRRARAAERQGLDFKEVARLYEPLAKAGHAEAMRRLGEVSVRLAGSYDCPGAKWLEKAKASGDPVSNENWVIMAAMAADGDAECAGKLGVHYRTKAKQTRSPCDKLLSSVFVQAGEDLYEIQAKNGSPEAMYALFIQLEDRFGDINSPRSQRGMVWGKKALHLGYAPMVFEVAAEEDSSVFGCSREQRRRYALQAQAAGVGAAKTITKLINLQDSQKREFERMKAEYERGQAALSGEACDNPFQGTAFQSPKASWPDFVYSSSDRELCDVILPIVEGGCAFVRRDGEDITLYRGVGDRDFVDGKGNRYYI